MASLQETTLALTKGLCVSVQPVALSETFKPSLVLAQAMNTCGHRPNFCKVPSAQLSPCQSQWGPLAW